MLQELVIVNGEMSPKFDIYNNIYTVDISKDEDFLVINYKVEEGYTVNIIDNFSLPEGESVVYIQSSNQEESLTYTLYVNKESTESVINYTEIYKPVEVQKELPSYVAPLISMICFLIILFTFCILFKKKKR